MQFRFFRRTRRRRLEEEHQPNGDRQEGVPIGAEATRPKEVDSEWLWWLSSSKPEVALSKGGSERELGVGRRWSPDGTDGSIPPAPGRSDGQAHVARKASTNPGRNAR